MPTLVTPVHSPYGAPMGRRGSTDLDTSAPLALHRVPVNSQGYDSGGAYWGVGAPLYEVIDQDGEGFFVRAANRADAKALVRNQYPDARFVR